MPWIPIIIGLWGMETEGHWDLLTINQTPDLMRKLCLNGIRWAGIMTPPNLFLASVYTWSYTHMSLHHTCKTDIMIITIVMMLVMMMMMVRLYNCLWNSVDVNILLLKSSLRHNPLQGLWLTQPCIWVSLKARCQEKGNRSLAVSEVYSFGILSWLVFLISRNLFLSTKL